MKLGIFIGRFQPFHDGHLSVIEQSLEQVDQLIVIVGSSNRARNTRNPFTYDERSLMIRQSLHWAVEQRRVLIRPMPDYPSDDRWQAGVRQIVGEVVDDAGYVEPEIVLAGFAKDHTSFYVKMFPEWGSIGLESPNYMISATHIRERFFAPLPEIARTHLPVGTVSVLQNFLKTMEFAWVMGEVSAKKKRDEMWAGAPFPPKDYCADAVVVQSGHILLVTRDRSPGKGLLALPGGHVNVHERIRDAAVREFREETHISDARGRVPAGRLASYITAEKQYDDPYRSDFGRVITTAFLFRLPDAKPLWTVVGSDDAADARWYPVDELRADQFHDDHYFIIQELLGL